MVLPDTNLLVHACVEEMPQHKSARRFWVDALNGDEPIGLAPVVLFGFLRMVTNRRIFTPPLDVHTAIDLIEAWLSRDHVQLLRTGEDDFAESLALIRAQGAAGNLTTDAQIAALALAHDATVISNDTDFKRFKKVRSKNPF